MGWVAIAAGLLGVFEDRQEADFEELFQRAMLLENRDVLFDTLDKNQQRKLRKQIYENVRSPHTRDREIEFWKKAMELFCVNPEYKQMMAVRCPTCRSTEIMDAGLIRICMDCAASIRKYEP